MSLPNYSKLDIDTKAAKQAVIDRILMPPPPARLPKVNLSAPKKSPSPAASLSPPASSLSPPASSLSPPASSLSPPASSSSLSPPAGCSSPPASSSTSPAKSSSPSASGAKAEATQPKTSPAASSSKPATVGSFLGAYSDSDSEEEPIPSEVATKVTPEVEKVADSKTEAPKEAQAEAPQEAEVEEPDSEWKEVWDDASQRHYYWNTRTNEVSWTRNDTPVVKPVVQQEVQSTQDTPTSKTPDNKAPEKERVAAQEPQEKEVPSEKKGSPEREVSEKPSVAKSPEEVRPSKQVFTAKPTTRSASPEVPAESVAKPAAKKAKVRALKAQPDAKIRPVDPKPVVLVNKPAVVEAVPISPVAIATQPTQIESFERETQFVTITASTAPGIDAVVCRFLEEVDEIDALLGDAQESDAVQSFAKAAQAVAQAHSASKEAVKRIKHDEDRQERDATNKILRLIWKDLERLQPTDPKAVEWKKIVQIELRTRETDWRAGELRAGYLQTQCEAIQEGIEKFMKEQKAAPPKEAAPAAEPEEAAPEAQAYGYSYYPYYPGYYPAYAMAAPYVAPAEADKKEEDAQDAKRRKVRATGVSTIGGKKKAQSALMNKWQTMRTSPEREEEPGKKESEKLDQWAEDQKQKRNRNPNFTPVQGDWRARVLRAQLPETEGAVVTDWPPS